MASALEPMEQAWLDDAAPPRGGQRAFRWRHAALGLAVVGALIAVVVGTYLTRTAPQPRPVGSPADEFAADRAIAHVKRLAAEPHPVGSPANVRAREYIVTELEELGLQPTVRTATAARGSDVARVQNIHARIPGRASTGHVVLVAHYDSVPQAPGGADDAAGVAAILETARALRAGPPPRNDVELVITDGEEPGLLGARAFVTAGLLDPRRSVVLNLEARGSSGPSYMFETSGGNIELIRAFSRVDDPVGGSEWPALYEMLPNDTDFTVFREAGFAGLNFAFADGYVHYHSPTDTLANLDRSSLQHHGANLLTLARGFGDQDVAALRGGDATYFTVFDRVVWYPERLVLPFALLALAALAATLWYARRRQAVRLRRVVAAAATVPLLLAVVGGLGVAAWWALGRVRPGYRSMDWGTSYRPEWYEAGLTVLAVTSVLVWYLALRRRLNIVEVALGVWAWLLGFAVALAPFVPGAAYLFTWPVLSGCAGLAVALRFAAADPAWRAVGASTAAFPAAGLWLPDYALGLAWAAGPMTMVALLAATAMPAIALFAPRRAWLVPAVAALGVFAMFAVGLRVDDFDAENPRQTSLVYAVDADRGTAMWLSADRVLAPWTKRYATERADVGGQFPGPLARSRHAGPAPVASIPPPRATLVHRREDGDTRVVRLRITAGGARRLDVLADTTSHQISATVEGFAVDGKPPGPDTGRWGWGFSFEAVPLEGIDVTLTIRGRAVLPLRLLSYRDQLPPLLQLTPLPEDLTWSHLPSNVTVVAAGYRA